MQKIKKLLVGLDGIVDNTYLDSYCSLIKETEHQERESFKTAKHHIIPVCYFKYKHTCKTRKEALQFANAGPNRIVNLTYDQHIMAHYYLSQCSTGQLHIGLVNAICLMLKKKMPQDIDQIDLTTYTQLHQEFLADVSRVHKGKIVSIESREKMSKAKIGCTPWMKGKQHTDDAKRKLAESSKGNTNALGYQHDDERRKKMSENCTRCRAVLCLETGQVFRSAHDVFKQLNIRHVVECCKNPKLTAGGYHWEYVENK
jgi:hypothetical protein